MLLPTIPPPDALSLVIPPPDTLFPDAWSDGDGGSPVCKNLPSASTIPPGPPAVNAGAIPLSPGRFAAPAGDAVFPVMRPVRSNGRAVPVPGLTPLPF
ncbi:MAG: hypothetical protein VB086_07425 [Clostridiaceae bacterium]|nr:hypothetical protein [Clostridiaceae bacterium]